MSDRPKTAIELETDRLEEARAAQVGREKQEKLMADLKTIEARREARQAKEREERDARDLVDLEALDKLEEQHGQANLMKLDLQTPLTLPGIAVIRRPDSAEYKNWHSVTRKGGKGEQHAATIALGRDVLLYPDRDVWDACVEALPGIADSLGLAALRFSGGVLEQKNE